MNQETLNQINEKKLKYHQVIGEIVVDFGMLESWLSFHIWELIGAYGDANTSQLIGKRVTKDLHFKGKVSLFESLCVERYKNKSPDELRNIVKILSDCEKERNEIVHSDWYIGYGNIDEGIPPSTHRIHEKRAFVKNKHYDFTKSMKDVDLEELKDIDGKMKEALRAITMFML
ncbi:hypothetical protein A2274_00055 [candidate division WWE3 bacterium RIFOXYA12_FULL_43_11]|uniref:Uncharacterized protein n=2 Tax=Katanobacteria TaxID=422282 RepID=A0A0G0YS77_UNCKA|nr:MAG: hypothetical protein UR43_C0017G0002 [candidate division TM6 bacterium GW2011_GWF2_33_332]KKS03213.1 MAG: hypothetical protein UU55_C0004G0002 [candidate division WWE3 bacterium GW2011_GWC2_41_23]OGC59205.1 MAG: hypothetical protein A2245_00380 [candidate division WWE3 bacterium RIFOXYA2_FULL_43_12]OGC64483.1 MAG: hypothetical protein A2274_00055 [candidate division WWE3 bacterium RIFOXYA12_FULL_43_11]HBY09769.1 hypothetical protein [candidate division WWE3 bacterium]HLD90700.1 hypothe